jgi:DNA-binding beta-propeller fold protein YncE
MIIRRSLAVVATTLGACAVIAAFAGPASAASPTAHPAGHPANTSLSRSIPEQLGSAPSPSRQRPLSSGNVFVLTNDATHNGVTIFSRGLDGRLVQGPTVPTGGRGGAETGAVVDPLASQGSLTYDAGHRLLFAVNAGSNTLSVFRVRGHDIDLAQIVPTSGLFPSSVAVAGDLVYVMDAGGPGAVTGFAVVGDRLRPIAGSTRSLGLANDPVPAFLAAPAQVAISPDRAHLVVATKSTGTLLVWSLDASGRPSAAATVTTSAGAVPFALTFDNAGRLQVAAASGSAASYRFGPSGTLSLVSGPVANGQTATCWSVRIGSYLYAASAGSATITGYRIDPTGALSLLTPSGVSATTGAGPVDIAASPDGQFLYELAAGAGAIDEFAVHADGSLTSIGTVAGLPADNGSGMEGIATS